MSKQKRISEQECYALFRKTGTPKRVQRHCRAVADTAVRIAEALNRKGCDFDVDLIHSAALIHDVRRVEPNHDLRGQALLESLGFMKEAKIVGVHMRHYFPSFQEATETDIVCLADRLVKEDAYAGLDERVADLIERHATTKEHVAGLLRGKAMTRRFMDEVEAVLGQSIDSLFRPTLPELLKQVEKPGRYIGGETNMIVKDPAAQKVRFAFAFPDLYEIGMSYVGLQILYHVANEAPGVYCERVFSPAVDMEALMRKYQIPLFTLETKTPVEEMDVLGFTLQYEMSYTTILNMLDLAGIPLLARDRSDADPLVVAGGPCAYNPEPLADFFDLFMIGDGEDVLPQVLLQYGEAKENGLSKEDYLKRISGLEGVYVPRFYEPEYNEDLTLKGYRKLWDGAPDRVSRAYVQDLETVSYPEETIVPTVEVVHDRSVVETFRGCTRGCRFCQAGMIYRPVRERSPEKIIEIASRQLRSSGHDELSILSLSTSDYSRFEPLVMGLMEDCRRENVALSLPSLRLDSFSFRVLEEIQKYKKSGLTFAPEAGTQRLRDVINKGITEDDIFSAARQAIQLGWRHIKFYFMDGLPTETEEDLQGICDIAARVQEIFRDSGARGRFQVTVSVSNFVPKAHTPFQWEPQATTEALDEKHHYLKEHMKKKGVHLSYHEDVISRCEAIFARGDRRCGELLLLAHEAGCRLDAWSENYDQAVWDKLLEDWSMDYRFYVYRERAFDEYLPWDLIDAGVTKEYLIREAKKAQAGETTRDCRYGCTGCGINRKVTCPLGGIYE